MEVLISIQGPDPLRKKVKSTPSSISKDGTTTLTSSGILVDTATIITSLSCIYPFLLEPVRSSLPLSFPTPVSDSAAPTSSPCLLLPGTTLHCTLLRNSNTHSKTLPAIIASIFRIESAHGAILKLLQATSIVQQWIVGWQSSLLSTHTAASIASHIVVLSLLDCNLSSLSPYNTTAQLMLDNASARHGCRITARGCPFGALTASHNTSFVSVGVISSCIPHTIVNQHASTPLLACSCDGNQQQHTGDTTGEETTGHRSAVALYVSDARVFPGMEGCPVTLDCTRNSLVGMMTLPIRSSLDASVNIAMIIPIQSILSAFLRSNSSPIQRSNPIQHVNMAGKHTLLHSQMNKQSTVINECMKSIVAVRCGTIWASGVCVRNSSHALDEDGATTVCDTQKGQGPCYIFTNAHAVNSSPGSMIDILITRVCIAREWRKARVAYIFKAPLDLAIIELVEKKDFQQHEDQHAVHAALSTSKKIHLGQSVVALGYPLWRPVSDPSMHSMMPCVTQGNIAKIVHASIDLSSTVHHPAVVMSTAAVYNGASGGALVDPENGHLLGLITSNTKLVQSNTYSTADMVHGRMDPRIYPCMNYAIPSTVLHCILQSLHEGCLLQEVEEKVESLGIHQAWKALLESNDSTDEKKNMSRLQRIAPLMPKL